MISRKNSGTFSRRLRLTLISIFLTATLFACESTTDLSQPPATHHSTVNGIVLSPEGNPLSGIIIVFRAFANTLPDSTNSDGTFSVRLTTLLPSSQADQIVPTTATIIGATNPPRYPELVADSLSLTVDFGPIDQESPTTEVTLTLPIEPGG